MKNIIINDKKYEVIVDYKEGFSTDEVISKMTDYFDDFDYIVGDWAYGKLRLKGFCTKNNSKYREINSYDNVKKYISNECAYDCKHFILEKIGEINLKM